MQELPKRPGRLAHASHGRVCQERTGDNLGHSTLPTNASPPEQNTSKGCASTAQMTMTAAGLATNMGHDKNERTKNCFKLNFLYWK